MVQLPCPIVLDWKCQPALAGYKGVILMVMISSGGWCLARVLSRNRITVCLELWTAAPSWAVCRGSVVVGVCQQRLKDHIDELCGSRPDRLI